MSCVFSSETDENNQNVGHQKHKELSDELQFFSKKKQIFFDELVDLS
jgi:hypothetical protein